MSFDVRRLGDPLLRQSNASEAPTGFGATDHTFEIAIVGDAGVGKTTLVQSLVSIGVITTHGKTVYLKPCECASNATPAQLESTLQGVDAVVVLYDLTNLSTFAAAERWVAFVREHTQYFSPSLMMLGTKSDLVAQRKVHFLRARDVAARLGLEPFDVTQVNRDMQRGQLLEAMAELCASIMRRVCPTTSFKASIVGHELREEEKAPSMPWFRVREAVAAKKTAVPAKPMWYEVHKNTSTNIAYYKMRCTTQDEAHSVTWEVVQRYSSFCSLHETLACAGIELPPIPRAHFFRGSADPEVVQERKEGLAEFVSEVVLHTHQFREVREFFDLHEVEAQLQQEAKIQGRMALSEAKEIMDSPLHAVRSTEVRQQLGIALNAFSKVRSEENALAEVRLLMRSLPIMDEDVDRVSEQYCINVISRATSTTPLKGRAQNTSLDVTEQQLKVAKQLVSSSTVGSADCEDCQIWPPPGEDEIVQIEPTFEI